MLLPKFLLAMGTLGLASGLGLGYVAWRLHQTEQTLLSRPTVTGRVLVSAVEARPTPAVSATATSQNHMYWQLTLRYAYDVDGRAYTAERLSNEPPMENLDRHDRPSQALTQYLQRYPVGSAVQVRYDPGRPERALLEVVTGAARSFILSAAVAALVAACAWGVLLVRGSSR